MTAVTRHEHGAGALPLAALLVALASAPADAVEITVSVAGAMGNAENGCNRIDLLLSGTGCSYGNDDPGTSGWAGPFRTGGYYAAGSVGDDPFYPPVPGDGKVAPALAGSITISDGGTAGVGDDDTIAATLVVGPAVRSIWTGNGTRAVERWESITHTLAPTAVTAATANAAGGFDYLIAPQGMPTLICSAQDPTQCFASESAREILAPPGFWSGPEAGGIGIERNSIQGGHIGAQTAAMITGYACAANTTGPQGCPTFEASGSALLWGGPLEDPGFDNLLLRLSTDASGNVLSAFGYWTQEFRIPIAGAPPGDNSWTGGTLRFASAVVPVPGAAWLFGSAGLALVSLARRGKHR